MTPFCLAIILLIYYFFMFGFLLAAHCRDQLIAVAAFHSKSDLHALPLFQKTESKTSFWRGSLADSFRLSGWVIGQNGLLL
jgi:hypothetical protein